MGSFKSPPVWGANVPFDFWLNEVKVWQAVTDLTVKKQGLAVALSLQGRRRDVALEIPIAQKKYCLWIEFKTASNKNERAPF